jgi:hypothetical protein
MSTLRLNLAELESQIWAVPAQWPSCRGQTSQEIGGAAQPPSHQLKIYLDRNHRVYLYGYLGVSFAKTVGQIPTNLTPLVSSPIFDIVARH